MGCCYALDVCQRLVLLRGGDGRLHLLMVDSITMGRWVLGERSSGNLGPAKEGKSYEVLW